METAAAMQRERDVKEIVGMLMRVLSGGEISRADVMDLSFEADGDLRRALNAAYIRLLELSHDREMNEENVAREKVMRAELQKCLDDIVAICERET